MINTEKVNSIKGFEMTTSFKEENLSYTNVYQINIKHSVKNEISYRTNTKVNTIVLILKCFGFFLSGSSFREPGSIIWVFVYLNSI